MERLGLLFAYGYINGEAVPVASAGIGVLYLVLLTGMVMTACRVLFGLAAYYDANAKLNPDAVMWGLLIGFLGLIPGIIYLCVRNSSRSFTVCPNCGLKHYFYDMNCPRCGAPNHVPAQYNNPMAAQQAHRAKVLLIVALVLIGVVILASAVFAVGVTTRIIYD